MHKQINNLFSVIWILFDCTKTLRVSPILTLFFLLFLFAIFLMMAFLIYNLVVIFITKGLIIYEY